MNRRRQQCQVGPTKICGVMVTSLILAGAIGAVGGVSHVYFRNRQIQTAREIDKIEHRIERHKLDIRTVQMRSDQILNLFAIRDTLEEEGTELVPIPSGISENIEPPVKNTVASINSSL